MGGGIDGGAIFQIVAVESLRLEPDAADPTTSVRALTVLDVVASTSIQVGLLVSGFLVTASVTRSDWLLDPYRAFLLAGSVATVLVLRQTTRPTPAP